MHHYVLNISLPTTYQSIIQFLQPSSQQNIGTFRNTHQPSVLPLLADNKERHPLESQAQCPKQTTTVTRQRNLKMRWTWWRDMARPTNGLISFLLHDNEQQSINGQLDTCTTWQCSERDWDDTHGEDQLLINIDCYKCKSSEKSLLKTLSMYQIFGRNQ
jgi:hypothetical protein